MATKASVKVKHRLFSVDDYYRMAEAGILHEDDRVELIGGEIVEMAPIGSVHSSVVKLLNSLFSRLLTTGQAIIGVQDPIRLNDSTEPEPDLMILRPRGDFYRSRHPGPSDVLLLIEVSDTSLAYDRDVKLHLYAEASIDEVWLVDLGAQAVEIHRAPKAGKYTSKRVATRGTKISPLAFPHVSLSVDEILGPGQASP